MAIALIGIAPAQVASDHFFVGVNPYPSPPSGSPAAMLEFDRQGAAIATHDLVNQLPPGIGTDGFSQVRPCEITPWGTVLCTTGYHAAGGWFEVDQAGLVGTWYSNPGAASNTTGAQSATVTNGILYGVHYSPILADCRLRAFSTSGTALWSTQIDSPLSPCVLNNVLYIGHWNDVNEVARPITTHTLSGTPTGGVGGYRHVWTLKALPAGKLLLCTHPSGLAPGDWFIRDLSSGSETQLDVSAYPGEKRWADVDDDGYIWILCDNTVVCFDPYTAAELTHVTLQGNGAFAGLAVSGSPITRASYATFGAGCVGPNGLAPSLAPIAPTVPRIGSTSVLRVTQLPASITLPVFIYGFSNTADVGPSGVYALPLDLSPLGWSGCNQLISFGFTELTVTSTGNLDHPLSLPWEPSWVGDEFFVQTLVLYLPDGIAFTNGVAGVIGY